MNPRRSIAGSLRTSLPLVPTIGIRATLPVSISPKSLQVDPDVFPGQGITTDEVEAAHPYRRLLPYLVLRDYSRHIYIDI